MLALLHLPSAHFTARVDGTLAYQKSRPREPVWYSLWHDDETFLTLLRVHPCEQTPAALFAFAALAAAALPGDSVLVSRSLLGRAQGLDVGLSRLGLDVYVPRGNSPVAVRLATGTTDWLRWMEPSLEALSEPPATCSEVNSVLEQHNILLLAEGPARDWRAFRQGGHPPQARRRRTIPEEDVAALLTAMRGRDPQAGRLQAYEAGRAARQNAAALVRELKKSRRARYRL